MRKLRAGALLGGLTLVAVLLLAGLVRAQLIGPFGHRYLQTVKQLCKEVPKDGNDSDFGFRDGCLFMVDILDKASGSDSIVDLAKPIAKTLLKENLFSTDTSVNDTCDACVQSVQDFESWLATNGTAAGLEFFFAERCADAFQDPADQDACVAAASDIPQFIGDLLAELPPLTMCQEAKYCPR